MSEYRAAVTKIWTRDDQFHRDDGPAIEYADGSKAWYRNDMLHREDGPAIERADGHKEWWRDGKLHREDGPAYEGANGTKLWCRHGKQLTANEISVLQECEEKRERERLIENEVAGIGQGLPHPITPLRLIRLKR